jgi:hypothetical protein
MFGAQTKSEITAEMKPPKNIREKVSKMASALSSEKGSYHKKLAPLRASKDVITMVKADKTKKILTKIKIDPNHADSKDYSPRPAASSICDSAVRF